ncbi:pre-mrna processing factor prp3 [Cystoisospora suis]|uniref:Pre-mrna processing factor prp3 n=1 Tax=Cystoisospora suis TaxID=483139 RepID=A0A2C6KYH4_9APIC|nr:pre-mrna processing factor prp3 [Cystoisospora suis]
MGGDVPATPAPGPSTAASSSSSTSAAVEASPAKPALPSLGFSLQQAAAAAREALEKAKKAALMQREIQERLKQHQIARPQGPAAAAVAAETKAGSEAAAAAAVAAAALAAARAKAVAGASTGTGGSVVGGGAVEETNAGTGAPLTLRALLGGTQNGNSIDFPGGGPSIVADLGAEDRHRQQIFMLVKEQQMRRKIEAEAAEKVKKEKQAAVLKARPRPLRFDEFGREVDEEGKVIPLKMVVHSDLKINRRAKIEARGEDAKQLGSGIGGSLGAGTGAFEDITQAEWYDPSIPVKTARSKRKRKAFEFVEDGRYIRQEQQMLEHQQMLERKAGQKLAREAKEQGAVKRASPGSAKKEPGATDNELGSGEDIKPQVQEEERLLDFLAKAWIPQVPNIEPWDAALVVAKPASSGDQKSPAEKQFELKEDAIDNLVEHPVPVKPAIDPVTNVIINMYLTRQERKKLRRRKRQEKEREKQDKIRMGLMPPPPPKIKLTNLMRVLGDQAVADPSKVEREVRQQMEKRLKDHEARNEARKLAPEVRSKKHVAKWQKKPNSGEFHVLLFCLRDLTNKRHLYKVDMNAQQLHLAGVAVICPSSLKSVVLVEGSLRSIKRFRALMLRRIKWREVEGSSAADDDDEDDGAGDRAEVQDDSCRLVWQGTVRTNSFSGWKVHRVPDQVEGRKIFKSAHVEHYWDMSQKYRDASEDL